jgi:Tfp pilus assembly major pilin PilA
VATIDLGRYLKVNITDAWEQHRSKKKPATVNAARARQTTTRIAAVAAETSIISSHVEANRAPNLFNSLSSQPTPQHSPPATAYIVSVIGQNRKGDRIKVLWSHMPGEPWWRTSVKLNVKRMVCDC